METTKMLEDRFREICSARAYLDGEIEGFTNTGQAYDQRLEDVVAKLDEAIVLFKLIIKEVDG